MDVNRISGYIPGKMVFFLMQVMAILNTGVTNSALPVHHLLITTLLQSTVNRQSFQAQDSVKKGKVAQRFPLKSSTSVEMCI